MVYILSDSLYEKLITQKEKEFGKCGELKKWKTALQGLSKQNRSRQFIKQAKSDKT